MTITIGEFLAKQENCSIEWANGFIDGILRHDSVHSGDCTRNPHSCNLCVLTEILLEYEKYILGKK